MNLTVSLVCIEAAQTVFETAQGASSVTAAGIMPMSQYQDLQAKLRLLYDSGLAPAIDSHSKLAQELGIRRQNVNKWINGADGYSPGVIPRGRATAIAELFSIELEWLDLPVAEFEHHIARRAESRHLALDVELMGQLIPVSLQRKSPLFGRGEALAQLSFAWTRAITRVVWLEGFGGSGKTALLAAWLEELAARGYDGAEGVFAWRFDDHPYASLAEAESQLLEALGDFLGLQTLQQESPMQGVKRLAQRICELRLLIVIDGFPEFQKVSVHSRLLSLLHELGERNPGLLVVSSTASLDEFALAETISVLRLCVGRLSQRAGIELLEAHGLSDHWDARAEIIKSLAGHPLALIYAAERFLSGEASLADVSTPSELLSSASDASPLAARSRRLDAIATAVYSRMQSESARGFLSLLSLLDTPVSRAQLLALRSWAHSAATLYDTAKLTDRTIISMLSSLEKTGAIVWRDQSASSLDRQKAEPAGGFELHPIVRVRLSERLLNADPLLWRSVHGELSAFFGSFDADAAVAEGFSYSLAAARHSLLAGNVKEGFRHYYTRYKGGKQTLRSVNRWSEQRTLRLFDPQRDLSLANSLQPLARVQLEASRAMNLIALGRCDLALPIALTSLSWFLEHEHPADALQLAGPLLSMLIATGRWQMALDLIRKLEAGAVADNDEVLYAAGQSFYGYVKLLRGNSGSAQKHFLAAEAILQKPTMDTPVRHPTLSAFYCRFLIETGAIEQAIKRGLQTERWREQGSWQVACDSPSLQASDAMQLGHALVEGGRFAEARQRLEAQLELLQQSNEWLYLPDSLIARARYHLAMKEREAAFADLHRAQQLADLYQAPLSRTEALLLFAEYHAKASNKAYAHAFLDEAKAIKGLEEGGLLTAKREAIEALIEKSGPRTWPEPSERSQTKKDVSRRKSPRGRR